MSATTPARAALPVRNRAWWTMSVTCFEPATMRLTWHGLSSARMGYVINTEPSGRGDVKLHRASLQHDPLQILVCWAFVHQGLYVTA